MKKLFVLLTAVALVCAFCLPAMAQEKTTEERIAALEYQMDCAWKFYGSARMATFWFDKTPAGAAGGESDGDLDWRLQSNSRIGARVKIGDIAGRFEYGITDQTARQSGTTLILGSHEAARVRLLFGTWNFGGGTLLVGKDYSPSFLLVSDQVVLDDNDLLLFGGNSGGIREHQIRLILGGFEFAALRQVDNSSYVLPTGWTTKDKDFNLPKLEAKYTFKVGGIKVAPFIGYQTYKVKALDAVNVEHSEDITSYVGGFSAWMGFGPAYFNASAYMGQNLKAYGWLQYQSWGATLSPTGGLHDEDGYGYNLVAGMKFSDMFSVEGGYGYQNSELDGTTIKQEGDASSYYINAHINFAKGMFIVPEIGKLDYGSRYNSAGAEVDAGSTNYYGIKWQIDF